MESNTINPPMSAPPTSQSNVPAESLDKSSENINPGTFEDLHKKTRDIFPMPFEGARFIVNKGLSNHFQISHTLTLSSLQPSGYKFGATYVGTKLISPTESFPILLGDIDPSGNVNANIIHQLTNNIRSKFVTQIQNSKWVISQLTTDYKGHDFTASLTIGNPDIMTSSGVSVLHYLQRATKNLSLGAELIYQKGPNVPGGHLGVFTLGGRYIWGPWTMSANITPSAGGLHGCFHRKINDNLQVAAELEGSLRTAECVATVGYQIDLPQANLVFRGQVDSNYQVGAVFEKKLPPLPFTFQLSGWANHVKQTFRFGVGLIVG